MLPSLQRARGADAVAIIEAPLKVGDGYRHGWVGITGAGKTFATKRLLAAPGAICLIHDDSKALPEYEGATYFPSVAALLAAPLEQAQAIRWVGFRGDVFSGNACEVQDVAALAMQLGRRRAPCRVWIDELNRAVSEGGKEITAPALGEIMMAGRRMGVSCGWNTLMPQRVPMVVWTMSSSIGFFRCERKILNYLDRSLCLPDDMIQTIAELPVGDFVLYQPGVPWDRTVYRF